MMLVDICQWRAAIGCFRAFTQKPVRFHFGLTLVSMLLQVFRLYKFACSFIFISTIILPFTIAIQFFVSHLLYPNALFLPLFSLTYSHARVFLYLVFELSKRIPLALYSLFQSKWSNISVLWLVCLQSCAVCLTFHLIHTHWVISRMILLSGHVEPNPGPDTLSFCCWNLNSIIAYDFFRVSLTEAYNSICSHDLIGVVKTHLDDTIDEERLILKGYDFITNSHPSNAKRGGVSLHIKETLPKTNRTDIVTLPECVVCEVRLDRKKYFWSLFTEVLARTNMNLNVL